MINKLRLNSFIQI